MSASSRAREATCARVFAVPARIDLAWAISPWRCKQRGSSTDFVVWRLSDDHVVLDGDDLIFVPWYLVILPCPWKRPVSGGRVLKGRATEQGNGGDSTAFLKMLSG